MDHLLKYGECEAGFVERLLSSTVSLPRVGELIIQIRDEIRGQRLK